MEKLIFEKMAAILSDIEPIKKEKTNTQGASFKYRGIDDVMNSLHESFAKHGVFITTEVLERNEVERTSKSGNALFYVTIKVKFTFHATDGSNVSSIIYGTAMDSGDKADNKCFSIALKYALLQAFLIPTEDMKDPDSETHEVKAEPKRPTVKLTPDSPKWNEVVKWLVETPNASIQALRKAYVIEYDVEQQLKEAVNLAQEGK